MERFETVFVIRVISMNFLIDGIYIELKSLKKDKNTEKRSEKIETNWRVSKKEEGFKRFLILDFRIENKE
jgi:hypothetical protein